MLLSLTKQDFDLTCQWGAEHTISHGRGETQLFPTAWDEPARGRYWTIQEKGSSYCAFRPLPLGNKVLCMGHCSANYGKRRNNSVMNQTCLSLAEEIRTFQKYLSSNKSNNYCSHSNKSHGEIKISQAQGSFQIKSSSSVALQRV